MLCISDINIVCSYEICEFIWLLIWSTSMICILYACLILLTQLWAIRKLILFYFYQVWCWEKVDNFQKFRVTKLLCQVFSKSRIQYLLQGEISVCNVLVPIKIVPVKNDYFLQPKFELDRYQQFNGFLYWRRFYWKKYGEYISHEPTVRLIPTWIWYNSAYQITSHLTSFNFVSLK